jgi:hypothetical protein
MTQSPTSAQYPDTKTEYRFTGWGGLRRLRCKPRGRERLSNGAIADQLNAERLPTRTGGQWRAGTVRRILRRVTASSVNRLARAAIEPECAKCRQW